MPTDREIDAAANVAAALMSVSTPSSPVIVARSNSIHTIGAELEPIPIKWNISSVGEIIGAFLWGEAVEEVADAAPGGFDCAGIASSLHTQIAYEPVSYICPHCCV